ncbi:unnamed protein product [Brassica oleracea]
MMREVCLSKAKEESFLNLVKVPTSIFTINAQSPLRSRRMVVHGVDAVDMVGHKSNLKARSVLIFGAEDNFWKLPSFRSLPLLRVLDLSYVQFKGGKLPPSIGELIHLRFLSLYEAGVSHLPSTLRNLKLLLCLNLSVADLLHLVHVPNVLKEMQELRYLLLPRSMHDKTKLELGGLVNLESLTNFSTKHSRVTDLLRMTKLRALSVSFTGGCTFQTLSSSLHELRNLETLSVHDRQKIRVNDHGGGDIVLDFIHLKDLTLSMHMPRFLDQYRFPPHLAHIWLIGCRMEEDPTPILEKLLHLKSVYFSSGAFLRKRMVCSRGGFPQLRSLKMSYQKEMEEWSVEEGSMPCLGTLSIDNCKKLKELPDGLMYITSLKELKIERMKREWWERLIPSGEDYCKVKHIPNVQFINCDGHYGE